MGTLAVHGHFLKKYSREQGVAEAMEEQHVLEKGEPKVRTFDDSTTSESEEGSGGE